MGLTPGQATTISNDKFNAVPQGSDYFPDGIFLRNSQTGEIDQYSAGMMHWVSVPVGTKLGLGAAQVTTISPDQFKAVPKGNDYFPDGMLLRNMQTGEIDIYSGGQRHWISVPVVAKMNLAASQLTTISPDQFNRIPQGKDYFPDGVYLQNQLTGDISQYSGGLNHAISAPVAAKMGLTSAQLISVSPTQYNAISKGSDYFPEGMFLQNVQSGEIDQYSGGQRHWVSPPSQVAIALSASQVTTIGADQFNAIPRGSDFVPPASSQTQTGGKSTV
jgi:hypothetical protein